MSLRPLGRFTEAMLLIALIIMFHSCVAMDPQDDSRLRKEVDGLSLPHVSLSVLLPVSISTLGSREVHANDSHTVSGSANLWRQVCNTTDDSAVFDTAEAVNFVINHKHGGMLKSGSETVSLTVSFADTCRAMAEGALAQIAETLEFGPVPRRLCGDQSNSTDLLTLGSVSREFINRATPLLREMQHQFVSLTATHAKHCTGGGSVLQMAIRPEAVSAALAALVQETLWESILVVSSVDEHLAEQQYSLTNALSRYNICVAHWEQFDHRDLRSMRRAVQVMQSYSTIKGVVLLASTPAARALFQMLALTSKSDSQQQILKRYWIGVDTWATSSVVHEDSFITVSDGALVLALKPAGLESSYAQALKTGYKTYLDQLNNLSLVNPWLAGAWERTFHCCLPTRGKDTSVGRTCVNCSSRHPWREAVLSQIVERAATTLMITDMAVRSLEQLLSDYLDQQNDTFTVVDGFVEYATPERTLAVLQRTGTLCSRPEDSSDKRCGEIFAMTNSSDVRYSVQHVQLGRTIPLATWSFDGGFEWTGEERNQSRDPFASAFGIQLPKSTCSIARCSKGYAPGSSLGDLPSCCQQCIPCEDRSYSNGEICVKCEELQIVNANATDCVAVEINYTVKISGLFPMFCFAVFAVGMVFVFTNFCFFCRYRNKHMVRAADISLVYVLLAGMAAGYIGIFTFLFPPLPAFCVARLATSRFAILVTISAVLVKTSRLAHLAIKSKKLRFKRNKGKGPQVTQYLFVFALVGVGMAVLGSLLAINFAESKLDGSDVICYYPGLTLPISDAYNFLILAASVLMALPLRSLPKGFNRSWLVLLMVLCISVIYTFSSVNVYISESTLPIVFVVRLFFLIHFAWIAVCYYPIRVKMAKTVKRFSSDGAMSIDTLKGVYRYFSRADSSASSHQQDIATTAASSAGVNTLRRLQSNNAPTSASFTRSSTPRLNSIDPSKRNSSCSNASTSGAEPCRLDSKPPFRISVSSPTGLPVPYLPSDCRAPTPYSETDNTPSIRLSVTSDGELASTSGDLQPPARREKSHSIDSVFQSPESSDIPTSPTRSQRSMRTSLTLGDVQESLPSSLPSPRRRISSPRKSSVISPSPLMQSTLSPSQEGGPASGTTSPVTVQVRKSSNTSITLGAKSLQAVSPTERRASSHTERLPSSRTERLPSSPTEGQLSVSPTERLSTSPIERLTELPTEE